ncbi:MAG: hypothetical protein ACP5QA_04125 [Phycisphaerae bacterium]
MMLVAKAGQFQVTKRRVFSLLAKFGQFWGVATKFSDFSAGKTLLCMPSNRILIALFVPCAGILDT